MKKKILLFFVLLTAIISTISPVGVFAYSDNYVYLGGFPAGFSLNTKGALVLDVGDVVTKNGVISPSKTGGIEPKDIILSINGLEVNNPTQIEKALKNSGENIVEILRDGEISFLNVETALDLSGNKKIGVFIRDAVSGIGTVTFIDNDRFASLGHPVVNENGKLIEITGGNLYGCVITVRVKGEKNKPGELCGTINKAFKIGEIDKNLPQGVYGTISSNFNKNKLIKIKTGKAKAGKAYIFSTVNGIKPEKYSISIVKSENGNLNGKNFVIKINDEKLLDLTNGIVQGMSGSPIIQNGKLVGAVTHVFINDSSRGFGISIENMLNN
ncbi:MAG: SpoIVB peptidase [Clostridia bacterium]|nr:SpoIVB peptidase [Clostridia bacterium]